MSSSFRRTAITVFFSACGLLVGCSRQHPRGADSRADIGPAPGIRVALSANGLPATFFQPGFDTKCASQIIGYRFVVWLDDRTIAVGFNTSPNCRPSPEQKVSGTLRLLTFDVGGKLKATRDLPYLADGNGELVADGEGMAGPDGTLLVRIESVNLDQEGRHESKSGVRLLDAELKDVNQIDGFLEQTTLAKHALVFRDGFTLSGPRTYSIRTGSSAGQSSDIQVDWPAGAMDRKFGESAYAFMQCQQELRPGQYTASNVVHSGTSFRCTLVVRSKGDNDWTVPLRDGETAALVGILTDDVVVGQIHAKATKADRLVIWRKGGREETLPWLPSNVEGSVDSSARDFSRYASFATTDAEACNPLQKILGRECDENASGRLFVFGRSSQTPLVNRAFPRNSRASLSPDGTHYASFEAGELRIYPLGRR